MGFAFRSNAPAAPAPASAPAQVNGNNGYAAPQVAAPTTDGKAKRDAAFAEARQRAKSDPNSYINSPKLILKDIEDAITFIKSQYDLSQCDGNTALDTLYAAIAQAVEEKKAKGAASRAAKEANGGQPRRRGRPAAAASNGPAAPAALPPPRLLAPPVASAPPPVAAAPGGFRRFAPARA